jgi:hypothetical protein
VRADFAVDRALDPTRAGLIGGAISGALGGLAADLATGGITLGAGALVGGLLGAAGSHGLARAYNTSRGTDRNVARWSSEFMNECLATAVLRYLVVAPLRPLVAGIMSRAPVRRSGGPLSSVPSQRARSTGTRRRRRTPNLLTARLAREVEAIVRMVLRELYPSFEPKEQSGMDEGSGPAIPVRAGRE